MGTWRGWADEEPDEQQLTDESLVLGSPSNTASTSTGGADEAGSEDSELEGVLAQTVALSRLRRQMSEDSGMADLAPEVQDEIAQLSSDLGRSLSPQQAQVLDAEISPLLGMQRARSKLRAVAAMRFSGRMFNSELGPGVGDAIVQELAACPPSVLSAVQLETEARPATALLSMPAPEPEPEQTPEQQPRPQSPLRRPRQLGQPGQGQVQQRLQQRVQHRVRVGIAVGLK